MSMSRKDYVLIAETIRELRGFDEPMRCYIAAAFAASLHRTNPRFDRERFIQACSRRV